MKKGDIKISELIPDDKNFNKGTEQGKELIKNSLTQFGAGRSILIDKNKRIIAGNKSVENAVSIGMENVQIVESDGTKLIAVMRTDIDLDTPQGRQMALADNATAKANIVWAEDVIADELGEVVADIWGIELAEVADDLSGEDDNFDVPIGGFETDIVLGDFFEIGDHKLLCGSATETDSWAKVMGEELADLVVTDPPYNVNYEGGHESKIGYKKRQHGRW